MSNKYLVRNRGRVKIHHIWDEDKKDTYCKMYSTGGLNKDKYSVKEIGYNGQKICTMCKANYGSLHKKKHRRYHHPVKATI